MLLTSTRYVHAEQPAADHYHLRGFTTDLDGRLFMNLQPTSPGEPFMIVGNEFASPDELVVRTIPIGRKPDKPSSTKGLVKRFKERAAAGNLFDSDSPTHCKRNPKVE